MRTFIAIELPPALSAQIERAMRRLSRFAPDARWVRPDNLHLTLAFLGELPSAVVPRVSDALAEVAARHPPHPLRVQGSGTFGPLDRPKVLWLAISGTLEPLMALQSALARKLALLGAAPDHEVFTPHITLARAKSPRGEPALGRAADGSRTLDFGELMVREVSLFESQTDRQGMRYRAMATHVLTGQIWPSKP